MERTLSIIGAPSSAGAYAPGQEKTPEALREIGLLDMFQERGVPINDLGNIDKFRWRPDPSSTRAMNIDAVISASKQTAEKVALTFEEGRPALVIGGDCTIEFGVLSGLSSVCNNVGMIYIDLDPDMQTVYSTSEGALDWMGVAHMLRLPGVIERFADSGFCTPLLDPKNLRLFMIDNARPFEQGHIGAMNIACDYMDKILTDPYRYGVSAAKWAERFDCVAVHLDIDVLNFGQMPLAENTRKSGCTFSDLFEALRGIVTAKNLAAFTITEVNPDHGAEDGSTLRTLAEALSDLFANSACLQ